MPVSSAQGRVGTTDGANRCRDLNARATMVVTPQQYHYACEAFIGYELHRFQIIVAEVFEYMIANILDRGFPSFKLRPRTTSGTALYLTEHGPMVVLEDTTDVSQQSEIQTYYTLQTFLGIHVEPEMVDAARDFIVFARHCMQNC